MSLSIKKDLTLRTEIQNRLTLTEIDENLIQTQALSLASSNSLIYLSESFSVDSSTPLADPALKSFNSRTIPSFLYRPFENGCRFVFKFSNTDYGYLGSASSTHLWWSVLAGDISYKVLSISQINSDTSSTSYPSYNNWDFNLTSLSFTNSTWTVTGTKIMGPTFSDFEPESIFAVGYKSMLSPTFSGGTGSIGGVVDGYTYFDYPTIQNKMYVGNLTYPIEIGVTGSSFSGTGSIVTVGGDGLFARNMVIGNNTSRGKIRLAPGNTYSSSVDIVFRNGVPCKNCRDEICSCWWGALFNNIRENKTSTCPCSSGINTGWQRPGSIGPVVDRMVSELIKIVNSDSEISASLQVDSLVLGITSSFHVGITSESKIGLTLSEYQPDLMLYVGRGATTSHSTQNYQVGLGIYNLSTSYLEITSSTYSENYTPILLKSQYGQIESSTYSVLSINSDAVSINKLYFGNATNGQSLSVSSGNLYVNGSTFSGGSASQGPVGATGTQGPVGATGPAGSPNYGTQSFTYANTVSVTHSFGRYPIIQVMDTTYDPPQMFNPVKIEYTTIDSFLVTFSTASSGILIYMC